MNANDSELKRRLHKLAAQNARLREIAESLAGRSALHGDIPSDRASQNTIEVFEEFDEYEAPRLRARRQNQSGDCAGSIAGDNRWLPRLEGEVCPLVPSPGWRCLTSHDAPIRLGFNLVGMDGDQAEKAVIEIEERQLRDRDFIPVFITDLTDFRVFRSRGYVFEYIPSSIAAPPTNRRAERGYYRERLALITEKWNLRRIVDLSA
jgi:hypothetical protein